MRAIRPRRVLKKARRTSVAIVAILASPVGVVKLRRQPGENKWYVYLWYSVLYPIRPCASRSTTYGSGTAWPALSEADSHYITTTARRENNRVVRRHV